MWLKEVNRKAINGVNSAANKLEREIMAPAPKVIEDFKSGSEPTLQTIDEIKAMTNAEGEEEAAGETNLLTLIFSALKLSDTRKAEWKAAVADRKSSLNTGLADVQEILDKMEQKRDAAVTDVGSAVKMFDHKVKQMEDIEVHDDQELLDSISAKDEAFRVDHKTLLDWRKRNEHLTEAYRAEVDRQIHAILGDEDAVKAKGQEDIMNQEMDSGKALKDLNNYENEEQEKARTEDASMMEELQDKLEREASNFRKKQGAADGELSGEETQARAAVDLLAPQLKAGRASLDANAEQMLEQQKELEA